MPSCPRKEIFNPHEPGYYHCFSRCVRGAYLCGRDAVTGKCYDHRKGWIERRLEFLASVMGLDVIAHGVMDNHFHVVLRNRPDVVKGWSDREVARRWLRVCPGTRRELEQDPPEPTKQQIEALMADRKQLAEVRTRLSSISWFMRFVDEFVARCANREEGEHMGRFWAGRFTSTALLDVVGILLCVMYVDLNPIRAGKAKTPEASRYTSAYRRIEARQARLRAGKGQREGQTAAAWLAPVELAAPPPDGAQARAGRRVSDKGFLEMSLDEYLRLLDWSGRQIRGDKRGAIPADLAPILQRLELDPEFCLEGAQSFDTWFADFAGRAATLTSHAAKIGRAWIRGMKRR